MRDQLTATGTQYPWYPQVAERNEISKPASYPDGAFWLRVYPPLGDRKVPMTHARLICPWSMAAQLDDPATPPERRQVLLEALKRGLKIIRQYNLPACRLMFSEDDVSRQITVWVD